MQISSHVNGPSIAIDRKARSRIRDLLARERIMSVEVKQPGRFSLDTLQKRQPLPGAAVRRTALADERVSPRVRERVEGRRIVEVKSLQ